MQRLAVEVELVLDLDREAGRAAAVDLVADERQVLAREVDADLVRAARVETAGDPGDGRPSMELQPTQRARVRAGLARTPCCRGST